jgi:hypothetical protein
MGDIEHLSAVVFKVTGLWIAGMLCVGQAAACQPPAGFVNPPRPEIAPLESLLSVTETKVIEKSLSEVLRAANRPLRIDATKDLAGVTGTYRLSDGPYGTVGARRLVCKTDGSIAVEEVLVTESSPTVSRFRYVVWNYTSPKFRDVAYSIGEFTRTQPAPDRTLVTWTYRFALRKDAGEEREARFREVFLGREFPEWMRTQLDRPSVENRDPDVRAPEGKH